MSFEKAKADLEEKGLGDHVIVLNESSATVAEAAHALGVEPASIAKTLSVLQGEKPVLIVTEGTAKLDNHKYKSLFHIKAKMIPYDEVEAYVGHAPGGVCPFGVNEGVAVYLDESLRKFDTVYPAAGNGHTAVKLTSPEPRAGWMSARSRKASKASYNKRKGSSARTFVRDKTPSLLHKSQYGGLPGSRKIDVHRAACCHAQRSKNHTPSRIARKIRLDRVNNPKYCFFPCGNSRAICR